MKNMMQWAIGGATLCALASCEVGATQERGPRPAPGGPPPIERMLDRLALTDDQKAAVDAVHLKNQDTMRPLGEAARRAHEAFQKALDVEAPDTNKVGQLAVAMHTAQKRFDAARKAEMEEIKAILTPEQRERLDQAAQRGPGHGPGRPGGPPPPDGPPDRN